MALQIVSDFHPDLLVVGSDGIDFCGISHFDRDPARVKEGGLQSEIDAWKTNQREWADAAGEGLRWFIPGNHEDRLRKYLWRHPELYGLKALSLPKILELEELGIGYDESDELIVEDSLVIKHGQIVRSHSAMTARAELEGEKHAHERDHRPHPPGRFVLRHDPIGSGAGPRRLLPVRPGTRLYAPPQLAAGHPPRLPAGRGLIGRARAHFRCRKGKAGHLEGKRIPKLKGSSDGNDW